MDLLDVENSSQADSFLFEENLNEDEINQIFNKWKETNPLPQTDARSTNYYSGNNEIDTKTFLRKNTPMKRATNNQFNNNDSYTINNDTMSMESGIASIDLNGPISRTPLSMMQKSWLLDVSPPNSLMTSINSHLMNVSCDLVTSSDFTNLNGSDNFLNGTFNMNTMDFHTRDNKDNTFTKDTTLNHTFTAINDFDSPSDSAKNRTFNKYNMPDLKSIKNYSITQSTPVQTASAKEPEELVVNGISPINTQTMVKKSRRLINDITQNISQIEMEHEDTFLVMDNNQANNETFDCQIESNEKEFDEMLNNITTVKKMKTPEKLFESSMLKRYSDKQKKEILNENFQDNKTMSELLSKSTERLLNRRSRLYDDFNNLQLAQNKSQQQQNEIDKSFTSDKSDRTSSDSETSKEKGDSVSTSSENLISDDSPNHDKFKTIRLSHRDSYLNERNREPVPMVIAAAAPEEPIEENDDSYRDRFKTIKLNKKRNDAIPVVPCEETAKPSQLKSPMGFKSKSCQSLINNGNSKFQSKMSTPPLRSKLANAAAPNNSNRLQSNLRMPRASSLVRPISNSNGDFKTMQTQLPKSVEDICSESDLKKSMGAVSKLPAANPRTSNLKPPTKFSYSGLPRPTFYGGKK